MNYLFFGAHPDDLEFLCGGTIAKCVARGDRVTMAVATNGNVGSPTVSREEIARIREGEARAAAQVLGASDFIWLNENDEFLFDNEPVRRKFVDAIRRAQADVVVTHNPQDYHPDHTVCSKLATDARILSAVRLIESEHPHLAKSPELVYMDSLAGLNCMPTEFVDVTAFMDAKRQALSKHESQNAWIRAIFSEDFPALMERQTSFRGMQAGVRYAEAFLRPLSWPRTSVPNLLP
jgi:LmbE family N-acetylglucosaminyl deacetylase